MCLSQSRINKPCPVYSLVLQKGEDMDQNEETDENDREEKKAEEKREPKKEQASTKQPSVLKVIISSVNEICHILLKKGILMQLWTFKIPC